MVQEIERYIGQRIEPMRMPTAADIAARRSELLKDDLRRTLEAEDLDLYLALVGDLVEEGFDLAAVAAAAALLARRHRPLAGEIEPEPPAHAALERAAQNDGAREDSGADSGMVRLFFNSGSQNGVRPADIVGAIANEAGVAGREIGPITIHERFSLVDVPARLRAQIVERMAGSSLRGRALQIRLADEGAPRPAGRRMRPAPPGARAPRTVRPQTPPNREADLIPAALRRDALRLAQIGTLPQALAAAQHQEGEEERPAEERREDADRQLRGRHDGAGGGVAEGEECAAAEQAGEGEIEVVVTDPAAHDMGNDQADEADGTGNGDQERRSSGRWPRRDLETQQRARSTPRLAASSSPVSRRVEVPAQGEKGGAAAEDPGNQPQHLVIPDHGEPAHHPAHHAEGLGGIGEELAGRG